jgi:integrase
MLRPPIERHALGSIGKGEPRLFCLFLSRVKRRFALAIERVCGGFAFTPYDLRRTFATTANDIGFSQDKNGQALNHKGQGVTADAFKSPPNH